MKTKLFEIIMFTIGYIITIFYQFLLVYSFIVSDKKIEFLIINAFYVCFTIFATLIYVFYLKENKILCKIGFHKKYKYTNSKVVNSVSFNCVITKCKHCNKWFKTETISKN